MIDLNIAQQYFLNLNIHLNHSPFKIWLKGFWGNELAVDPVDADHHPVVVVDQRHEHEAVERLLVEIESLVQTEFRLLVVLVTQVLTEDRADNVALLILIEVEGLAVGLHQLRVQEHVAIIEQPPFIGVDGAELVVEAVVDNHLLMGMWAVVASDEGLDACGCHQPEPLAGFELVV